MKLPASLLILIFLKLLSEKKYFCLNTTKPRIQELGEILIMRNILLLNI